MQSTLVFMLLAWPFSIISTLFKIFRNVNHHPLHYSSTSTSKECYDVMLKRNNNGNSYQNNYYSLVKLVNFSIVHYS